MINNKVNILNMTRFCAIYLMVSCVVVNNAYAENTGLATKLIGSWSLAKETITLQNGEVRPSWGKDPYSFLTFDGDGNFAQILARSDLPLFETRWGGTMEQNDKVAKGSLAYFGTYKVNEESNELILDIVGGTFTTFNGTQSIRKVESMIGNEMVVILKLPSIGISTELTWRKLD